MFSRWCWGSDIMKKILLVFSLLIGLALIFSCGKKITQPQEIKFDSATINLDNVVLWGAGQTTLAYEQLLSNGGMESWPDGDSTGAPDNWNYMTDAITAGRDSQLVEEGDYSAGLTWTSSGEQIFLSDPIPVFEESTYTCSLYVYDSNSWGTARPCLISNSNNTIYQGATTTNSNDWQLVTFSAIIPSGVTSVRVGLKLYGVIEGLSDTVYVQLNPPWDTTNGYNFNGPQKVIVGMDTYIYVCDTGNDRIVRLDAAGTVSQTYTVPHPTGVTQDELLRLLVVNGTQNVYKIDVGPGGDGLAVISFSQANDTTLMPSDFIFTDISDVPGNAKTYLVCGYRPMVDGTGQVFAVWNSTEIAANTDTLTDGSKRETFNTTLDPAVDYGTGVGYTDHPNGITAFLRNNNLYLLMTQDSSTFKTQLLEWYVNDYYQVAYFQAAITPGGDNDIYAEANLPLLPSSACIDSSGNIYFTVKPDTAAADSAYSAYKFDNNGRLKEVWGPYGTGSGQMNFPSGIAYDNFSDRRTVYIADTGNNRILRFKLSTDIE